MVTFLQQKEPRNNNVYNPSKGIYLKHKDETYFIPIDIFHPFQLSG